MLNNKLDELRKVECKEPTKVFTLYLNTDRSDANQQDGEWKIRLKNGLKRLQEYIESSHAKEELKQFKKILKKVEDELYGNERDLLKGVVMFVTSDDTLWFKRLTAVPVENAFYWENAPMLQPLIELGQNYPYTGIVLIQKNRASLLETEMGELYDTVRYTLNLDTDDWREHKGPQGNDLTTGGRKKDEFAERVAAHQHRWFKSLASKIEKKAGHHEWKQLYLVGEKDEVEHLKSYFRKNIDKIVPRNLLNREDHEILTEVLNA